MNWLQRLLEKLWNLGTRRQRRAPVPPPVQPSPVPSAPPVPPSPVLPHGPETYNVLALPTSPWLPGTQRINESAFQEAEAYAKAGPTHLILCDLLLVLDHMRAAGFDARDTVLYYVLSRGYAWGDYTDPVNDTEGHAMYERRGEVADWFGRYVDRVYALMEAAPETTAQLVDNDFDRDAEGKPVWRDRLGRTLQWAMYRNAPDSIRGRLTFGETLPD